VEGNPEAWPEVMKLFRVYGAIDHLGELTSVDLTAREGKYLIVCDLESQSHKSMVARNGVDVSTSVLHFTVKFNAQLKSSLIIVDVFSHYDNFILVGADGLVSVVSY
jgi:hypothetical protein